MLELQLIHVVKIRADNHVVNVVVPNNFMIDLNLNHSVRDSSVK